MEIRDKILGFDGRGTLVPTSNIATEGRPGVFESLRRYQKLGNKVIVASAALNDSAVSEMLREWGIDGVVDLYKAVDMSTILDFDRPEWRVGKLYRPLLDQLVVPAEEAPARMVVTGDKTTDFAGDISGVVFIYDQLGAIHTLDMYEQVVETLDRDGGGNLYEGFCRRVAERTKRSIDLGSSMHAKWRANLQMLDQFEHPDIEGFQVPLVAITRYPNM